MAVRAGQMIYSELQSIANGIGKHHNGVYVKEQDALGNLWYFRGIHSFCSGNVALYWDDYEILTKRVHVFQ
mgnify:CR=1 FL=1